MPKVKVKPDKKNQSGKTNISSNIVNARPLDINKKPKKHKLANVWSLSASSLRLLWRQRLLFIGIVLIFGVINFAIANGFSAGANLANTKNQFTSFFHGQFKQIEGGLTVFTLMLTNAGSSNTNGGLAYGIILTIMVSLSLIWAIRNTSNNTKVRIRDAYYRSMYPIVPFILVLLVIVLEMIPLIIGTSLYVTAAYNNIAVNGFEQLIFGVLALALTALSLYWLSSSIFALYIVTLPDMTPMKALSSAKKLVKKRRLQVILRVLYLPLALLILSAVVMLPTILFVSVISQWVFMLLTLVFIALFHSYFYNLYRELLDNEQS